MLDEDSDDSILPFDEQEDKEHRERRRSAYSDLKKLFGKVVRVKYSKTGQQYKWKILQCYEPVDPFKDRPKTEIGLSGLPRNFFTRMRQDKEVLYTDECWCLQIIQHLWMGDWKEHLKNMNELIGQHNEEDPRHPLVQWEEKQFWGYLAILVLNALEQDNPAALWTDPKFNTIRPSNYKGTVKKFFSSYDQFSRCRALFHRVFENEELKNAGDPWWRIRDCLDQMNAKRRDFFMASLVKVLDESMLAFRPQTTKTGKNLDHISYEGRKPESLGTELKNVCDGVAGVVLHQEFLEGKERMKKKEFVAGVVSS